MYFYHFYHFFFNGKNRNRKHWQSQFCIPWKPKAQHKSAPGAIVIVKDLNLRLRLTGASFLSAPSRSEKETGVFVIVQQRSATAPSDRR